MIEVDVTKNKKTRRLKYDSVFLLNDVESNLYDKPIEKDKQKRKYEQAVRKCNKWRSVIKKRLGEILLSFKK